MRARWFVAAAVPLSVLAAAFPITGCGGSSMDAKDNVSGDTITYYVAADEVPWDFAPSGLNLITGEQFSDEAKVFVDNGPGRIGRVYMKALYREYTDHTFTQLKPVPPEWEHLGTLGPVLRAEAGQTIRVVFKNNCSFPASMHPHGVFYNEDSEGAPYVGFTPDSFKQDDSIPTGVKQDDSIPTGGTWTYEWPVPERAGPGGAETPPASCGCIILT